MYKSKKVNSLVTKRPYFKRQVPIYPNFKNLVVLYFYFEI